jgi:soluble lytic murein transglycosylase-like protein
MMAESAGNAKAVSRVGAKGLYQIMDPTHQDYIKATGDNGDLFDPEHNTRVRD